MTRTKKSLLTILSSFALISFVALAQGTNKTNEYRIDQRPFAKAFSAKQYAHQALKISKPYKQDNLFYTTLNLLKPHQLYTIAPYPNAAMLPYIGDFMLTKTGNAKKSQWVPAHWLNELASDGRYIIEPINYLFLVKASTEAQSKKRLINTFKRSGISDKWSGEKYHSDNYHAFMNDTIISQIKNVQGIFLTFSNENWKNQNDHFRAMGPYVLSINHQTYYLYAASVSEESAWDDKINAGHHYVSFSHARNNIAIQLIKNHNKTYYIVTNNTLNNQSETTEDHDGKLFITIITS